MKIPDDYLAFLHWFKSETEKYWQDKSKSKPDWIAGARWVGLQEDHIKEIENKYNISFTSEHKDFLKVLHAIDKKQPEEYYDDNDELCFEDTPYFYNWLTDEEEISGYLKWPYEQILSDAKDSTWLKSWGDRPQAEDKIEKVFSTWYNKAPKLIPIKDHRFVVSGLHQVKSPVLSVWGTDTVVYGWSIKQYLLYELENYLDAVFEPVYDEKDKTKTEKRTKELTAYHNSEWALAEEKGIPYWSELVTYANPDWKYIPA